MKTAILVIGGEKYKKPNIDADVFTIGKGADFDTGSMLTGESIASASKNFLKKYKKLIFANSDSGFSIADIESSIAALDKKDVVLLRSEDGDVAIIATKKALPEKLLADVPFFTGATCSVLSRKLADMNLVLSQAEKNENVLA